MELKKISESYSIKDTTDIWNVEGTVTKEVEGTTKIAISANTITNSQYVGSFNYTINDKDNVSVNFDCGKSKDDTFFAYGNKLVDEIVDQLK